MSAPDEGFKTVVEDLPAVDGGRRLRRIATVAIDDGFDDTYGHAFESSDGSWSFGLGLLAEQTIDMYDLPTLTARTEEAARLWCRAVARMCVRPAS